MTQEKTKKWTCPLCDEEFNEEPEDVRETLKGEIACSGCEENGFSYATKLFKFAPGGEMQTAIFDEDFVYLNETDDSYDNLPEPIAEQFYKQTDGWRGYTDWKLSPGYIEYAGGWVTGYPDETTKRKAELSDYFNDLHDGKLEPPCPLYWLFGQTSNVFSQTSMIIIHKDDEEKVNKWINKINGTPDEFKERFK